MSVTTEVISSIHARSPAVVSCTANLSSSITDGVTVNITWSKDNRQLHNNSDLLIVSANLSSTEYQSNMTIHVLEASDVGLYSCSAGLISRLSNRLISQATSSIYLNVEGIVAYYVMLFLVVKVHRTCLQAKHLRIPLCAKQ